MRIGNKEVGPGHPCYIIAELGINHNGSMEICKKLIDVAVLAGADAVKFQKRSVDVVYTEAELSKPRESPFGATNGDLKRGLEFGVDEYLEIHNYRHGKGIDWFASPWDVASVVFLQRFDVPVYKVASACLTDAVLLDRIAQTERPVILSTGMSTTREIERAAVEFEPGNTALLACTSTYPAKTEELNLNRILTFKEEYSDYVIGYSGHEVGLWPTLCAVAMGADIVERHITLDRAMWGSDQAASIEPAGFIKLVREIRDLEKAKGTGIIGPLPSELPILEKLRRFK